MTVKGVSHEKEPLIAEEWLDQLRVESEPRRRHTTRRIVAPRPAWRDAINARLKAVGASIKEKVSRH